MVGIRAVDVESGDDLGSPSRLDGGTYEGAIPKASSASVGVLDRKAKEKSLL